MMMYTPPSSPGLYVPVHRRTPSSSSESRSPPPSPSPSPSPSPTSLSSSSSPYTSPSSSTRSLSPGIPPHIIHTDHPRVRSRSPHIPIYTPADLLLLSTSPLAKPSAALKDALRSAAPELVQSRRQRKALAWHARHSGSSVGLASLDGTEGRTVPVRCTRARAGAKEQQKRSPSYPSHARVEEETWRV